MKKILFLVLMLFLAATTFAVEIEIDGIWYDVLKKGNVAKVIQYKSNIKYSGNIIIPETVEYEGVTCCVTSIENGAFHDCNELTSVIISNGISSIENGAFSNCSGLISVTIPNSVMTIGYLAFERCSALPQITIPGSVKRIGFRAFENCSALSSVIISHGVNIIESCAFNSCISISSITIPNSVTNIEYMAFAGCVGLTKINIGSGVKNIESKAFANCPEITDLFCYATHVPTMVDAKGQQYFDVFDGSYIDYATLHVPSVSISAYKSTAPWSGFKNIVSIDGDTSQEVKCAQPVIIYKDGLLSFDCQTSDVVYHYSIKDADIIDGIGNCINLSVTYYINVWASKDGYEDSDVATATLCWIDVDPKTEGISNGVANMRAMPVIIQNNGNVLNVTGALEGSEICVYDLSGQMVGSAKAVLEATNISTSLRSGEIGIVKIGDKSVKVKIK